MTDRPNNPIPGDAPFTEEQQNYLQGFFAGGDVARSMRQQPTFAMTLGLRPDQMPGGGKAPAAAAEQLPTGPEAVHFAAQDRQIAEGKKLVPEEVAKRKRFPLDVWD